MENENGLKLLKGCLPMCRKILKNRGKDESAESAGQGGNSDLQAAYGE